MRDYDLFATLKVKECRKMLEMSIHPSFPCNPFVQHGGYLTYPTQKLLNFVVSIILSHRQYLDQVLSQK